MKRIEPGDICENGGCAHPATMLWIGDNGTLAISRDYLQQKWCDCCMTRARIAYAEALMADLAELKAALPTQCIDRREVVAEHR